MDINQDFTYEVFNGNLLKHELVDLTKIVNILSEFYDVNCAVLLNDNKPLGVALGKTLSEAYLKAFDCDPINSLEGFVGFSAKVDVDIAKHINSTKIKIVVAPDFSDDAIEVLKNTKLIKLKTLLKMYKKLSKEDESFSPFGVLVKDFEKKELDKDTFKVITKEKPTAEKIEDAVFAWKVAKYTLPNSVVITKDFKTISIKQGQSEQIKIIEEALDCACDASKDAVVVTDFSLNNEECLYSVIQGRIGLFMHTGSSNDENFVKICNKYSLPMITTGVILNK